MNPSEVTFHSDSLKIAGYLYTPADWKTGDASRPGILALAGYSGNTQADCTHMMKRLCAEGRFVFGFDYQGFGKSEGRRNRHRALEQAQNCHDAISSTPNSTTWCRRSSNSIVMPNAASRKNSSNCRRSGTTTATSFAIPRRARQPIARP